MEFHHLPPLQILPPSSSPCLSTEQEHILDVKFQELVQKNAIREADVSTPGFYSQVSKKGVGWRPVINLKRLNNFRSNSIFQDGEHTELEGCSLAGR